MKGAPPPDVPGVVGATGDEVGSSIGTVVGWNAVVVTLSPEVDRACGGEIGTETDPSAGLEWAGGSVVDSASASNASCGGAEDALLGVGDKLEDVGPGFSPELDADGDGDPSSDLGLVSGPGNGEVPSGLGRGGGGGSAEGASGLEFSSSEPSFSFVSGFS